MTSTSPRHRPPATFYRVFDDTGPDLEGKRSFTVTWVQHHGVYRPELGLDGEPVGYRRGQCFRTNPEEFVRRALADGDTVVDADGATYSPNSNNGENS